MSADHDEEEKKGMSLGAKIGIAIAVLILGVFASLAITAFLLPPQKKRMGATGPSYKNLTLDQQAEINLRELEQYNARMRAIYGDIQ